MRPICSACVSVNQRLPSGPAAISAGTLFTVSPLMLVYARGCWVVGLNDPIAPFPPLALGSVNHRLPSEPTVMPPGLVSAAILNSLLEPVDGTARPTAASPPPCSTVNQIAPSGPAVMPPTVP